MMMTDITMCKDKDCDKHSTCYRYTATPNQYRQRYFIGKILKNNLGDCIQYVPNTHSKV